MGDVAALVALWYPPFTKTSRGGSDATRTTPRRPRRPSGRAMARTGLRMMPTFPLPPLKFRTAGFPQYGFKASLSAGACPSDDRVKLTPSIPRQEFGLPPPSRAPRLQDPRWLRFLAPQGNPEGSSPRDAPLTPGVLGSDRSSAVSDPPRLLRPHPPVSQAPRDFTVLPLIPRAFAVRERRGDPRDLPYFPWRAVPTCRRPYPRWVRWPLPFVLGSGIPGSLELRASRHPHPRLCQQCLTGVPFQAASFASCCGPCVCPALLAGYNEMPTLPAPRLLRYRVTPAFGTGRRRAVLGVRLDGRTGNLPSSGLAPD